jgi:hypothetical protein
MIVGTPGGVGIPGGWPKTITGMTINADNTIAKAIHLLMALMALFLLFCEKSQKFFESYYPEMRTLY